MAEIMDLTFGAGRWSYDFGVQTLLLPAALASVHAPRFGGLGAPMMVIVSPAPSAVSSI